MNTLEKEAIQYMKWKNISSLTATDYQNSACKTAIFPKELGVQYLALGLTGEAGEVANKVKKLIRDGGDSPDTFGPAPRYEGPTSELRGDRHGVISRSNPLSTTL